MRNLSCSLEGKVVEHCFLFWPLKLTCCFSSLTYFFQAVAQVNAWNVEFRKCNRCNTRVRVYVNFGMAQSLNICVNYHKYDNVIQPPPPVTFRKSHTKLNATMLSMKIWAAISKTHFSSLARVMVIKIHSGKVIFFEKQKTHKQHLALQKNSVWRFHYWDKSYYTTHYEL